MHIIPILKLDGTVRICGDYMVTLNCALDLPKYPMPTAEKLSLPLNSGEMFLKLDLSSACQQVLSYEEFRQYVTIGTVSLYMLTDWSGSKSSHIPANDGFYHELNCV